MVPTNEKLAKLEKRLTDKSVVIHRKKSKITDFFKKKRKFVTLSVPKAVQVDQEEHIQNNDKDFNNIPGQNNPPNINLHMADDILWQDLFLQPNENDYVPWALHDFDDEMKCRRCLIVPDNQLCPFF